MTRLLASYDVFDTVVTRAFAHPRDVFVYVGVLLQQRAVHRHSPETFAAARWAAELAAHGAAPQREFHLDEIYRVLAQRLAWDDSTAATAKAIELETESRFLRPIPSMAARLEALRRQGTRLAFLSDMYLPSSVLRPWLERAGVVAPGELLLISGEARGNKSTGQLFRVAQRETGATFDRWQHTGDNLSADVEGPRRLGISATHFTAAHLTPREWSARGSRGEFAAPWRSLLAGAMRLARLDRTPASEREARLWEIGTNVAGPLFYGFVRWALAEAERRGLRRLYFMARDSQIFWKVAQAIQRVQPGPVECHYLYGSRLAFSGLAELTSETTLRQLAIPPAHFHSLRQVLRQLGLDPAWAARELPAKFGTLDLDANLPWDTREELADWLLAPERLALVRSALEQRAARARGYLASVGLVAGEPVGLLDTGWFGSMHRNLERIVGSESHPIPLTGFYLGLKPMQPPPPAGELLAYTNLFSPLLLCLDESHKVLVELMSQSDHGQVIGFESAESGFAPILRDPGPVNLGEIKLFQDAVLAFTSRMLETASAAPAPEADFAKVVIDLYRQFHDQPSRPDAELFGFLPHADQLFEQRHATLISREGTWVAVSATIDHPRRPPHWWIQGQAAIGGAIPLLTFRYLKKQWWKIQGRHL